MINDLFWTQLGVSKLRSTVHDPRFQTLTTSHFPLFLSPVNQQQSTFKYMELTLSTPAILFSANSFVLLAFTNRFLALAQLVRGLHAEYKKSPSDILKGQIHNLRKRLRLIRATLIYGMLSLLLCVVSIFSIYFNCLVLSEIFFILALIATVVSLLVSIWEIQISVKALDMHLSDIEIKNED